VSVSTRRVIARVSIAVDIAVLIAVAIGVRVTHHSLGMTIFTMAAPVSGALCGLAYLRSTRGKP
jgi:hypothetical protein